MIIGMNTKIRLLTIIIIGYAITTQAQSSLSLDSCRTLATENNKALKIASEKEKKAHYERKAAFAQYLPDFSFTGSYMYNQKNLSLLDADRYLPIGTVTSNGSFGFRPDQINNQWRTTGEGQTIPLDVNGQPFNPQTNPEKILWKDYTVIPKNEFEMDMKHVWAGIFSVVQPVFMGGKIMAYNQIAKYAEELAATQKDTELQQLILQTDEAYWQTVSLVNKKRLAISYIELLQRMDTDMQELIKEGFATKADGLSVKVKLNEAEMAETKVDNGLRLTRMLLAQICGLPLDEEFILSDELSESLPLNQTNTAVDIEQAYLERPELKSLDLATKIYQKKETIARSEMMPSVALSANYAISNPSMFNGFQHEFAGMWNVGVIVRVPLFHWGEKMHHLNAAKTETRIKRLEMEEVKEKISLQINQSVFHLNETERKVVTAKQNLESAEENLRHANLGFEEGVIPVLQIMEAQSAWLKANSELIDAQIDAKLAEAYLKKAVGKGNIDRN